MKSKYMGMKDSLKQLFITNIVKMKNVKTAEII